MLKKSILVIFSLLIGISSCNVKSAEQPHEDTIKNQSATVESSTTEAPEVKEEAQNTKVSDEPVAQTSTQDPIDKAYEDCMGESENQTTVGMCDCAGTAKNQWDEALNKTYGLLMKGLNDDEKAKLKEAQLKWIAYRDAEFSFSGTKYYNMEGTMYRVMAVEREKEFVKTRALELRRYYSVFVDGEE